MNSKQKLVKKAKKLADKAGGSTITRERRRSTAKRWVEHLHSNGFPIHSPEEFKAKHVESYANERIQKVGIRTVHNDLAHVRAILSAAEKNRLAESSRLSNETLCGRKAQRTRARQAPTRAERAQYFQRVERRDYGVAAVMWLLETLGLRSREGVQAVKSLKTWERQLEQGTRVTVTFGTKGGRPREVAPHDRQAALSAVRYALSVAKQRGGLLVQSKSGTLRAAMRRFSRVVSSAGVRGIHSPHSFRYAFAQERIARYLEEGYSEQEALALTSQDLGHGDGRGRWVAWVYGAR
jgi:hypothetical protein